MNSPRDKLKKDKTASVASPPVRLKQLAAHLGLNPATVSLVLNDVPGRSIPQATRDRIKAAAKALNYQPNLVARSLQSSRTQTVGILLPELGEGYHTQIMSGIGNQLLGAGYFYFTAHHHHQKDLVEEYARMLIGRGAQGILAIDTQFDHPLSVPVVAVAGHRRLAGITNVCLDHERAVELALEHLYRLGHRKIAFMRGRTESSDTDSRWTALRKITAKMGLKIIPELVVHLDGEMDSPEAGPRMVQQLLGSKRAFTALFAFNDIAAIGSISALQNSNLRVPADVSVIGFDNIKATEYTSPRLTTISQNLDEIGKIATQCLLNRLHGTALSMKDITIEPKLVIRESTGIARS